MPNIVKADDVPDAGSGPGWARSMLADRTVVNTGAMTLERLSLDPGAEGPELVGGDRERFVYVMDGGGTLTGSTEAELAPETIVWIEPGDRLRMRAGPEGIRVLVAGSGPRASASGSDG